MSGHDIVILSTQDWDDLWTRKQRFARLFAQSGNRVLYVESQVHWLTYLRNIRRDSSRAFRWSRGSRRQEHNLYVYTLPPVPPFAQMSALASRAVNSVVAWCVRREMQRLGFTHPILIVYTPYSASLLGRLGERLAVYECVDEFSASRGLVKAETIAALEEQLLRQADLTIVTAEELLRRKRALARRIMLIPNAAEVQHFVKASDPRTRVAPPIARLARPVIGYLGTVAYWIDLDLIQHIARARPDWSIVLIGPVGRLAEIRKVKNLANVHVMGRVPYDELPGWLKGVDVCINPYKLDGVAEHCSPLKLYEYLATGKPVVSVDMPAAREFKDVIRIAADKDDFVTQIEEALTRDGTAGERIPIALSHAWESRFAIEQQAIARCLEEVAR